MAILTWRGLPVVTGRQWRGVQYFCTTRNIGAPGAQQGVSTGPYASLNVGAHVQDDAQSVRANRERLARDLPSPPIWLEQVHGVDVVDLDVLPDASTDQTSPPIADAAVTTTPGRVLAIMTADCLPVVISDAEGRAVGAAHAGWRGLQAGVLENTLEALRRRTPSDASWQAWLGPAIGKQVFEVGDEVRHAFMQQDASAAQCFVPNGPGKWLGDLAGIARQRLLAAGVAVVEDSGLCTYARSDLFYSYRRDGATGRMATLAWLDPST